MHDDLRDVDGDGLALRHIKLDDLLHLAAEATVALGILNSDLDDLGATREAYAAAITQHLATAEVTPNWAGKVTSLDKAAVLIRFCAELHKLDPALRLDFADEHDPGELHDRARRVLEEHTHDYTLVRSTHLRAREHRLGGDSLAALCLVTKPQDFFAGSGAEAHKGDFELEQTFDQVVLGNPDGAVQALREYAEYWTGEIVEGRAARGRYDQAVAVAHLARAEGNDLEIAVQAFRDAACRFKTYLDGQVEGHLERLSVLLTLAGLEASRDGAAALAACREALQEFESLRSRWTVVARSPSPLSLVLRIVLGELAQVLVSIRDGDALQISRAALHLSLAAKHSGAAELIRTQRDDLSPRVRRLLKSVVAAEDELFGATDPVQRRRGEEAIDRLRNKLETDVSRLLAGLVLPSTVDEQDVDRIVARAEGRFVLDFVHLPTLLAVEVDGEWNLSLDSRWFRTCFHGADVAQFDIVRTGSGYDGLFRNGLYDIERDRARGVVDMFASSEVDRHPAWREAAAELLPGPLLRLLREERADTVPVEILISPHGELSRLPWAALVIDEKRRRLVQRATILSTPLLSSYTGETTRAVAPALVRIVDEASLEPSAEQDAWGMRPAGAPAIPLASCTVPTTGSPMPLISKITRCLADPPAGGWGLVYVASHGSGRGFGQKLWVPEEELTAGAALGHPWPPSVVLNACHGAAISDDESAEPMGFVIAAMAGGAREVVGAVHVIGAPGAARIGASIINALDGVTPLHELLHSAQRQLIEAGADVRLWAALAAFVR